MEKMKPKNAAGKNEKRYTKVLLEKYDKKR